MSNPVRNGPGAIPGIDYNEFSPENIQQFLDDLEEQYNIDQLAKKEQS